jgi:hypothetical protein
MIAIDYLGGGKAVQFHVLTWVASGACFVANDPAPCWGATVLEIGAASAEGGVSTSNITLANNPISNAAIKAGQFAEFGINLTDSTSSPTASARRSARPSGSPGRRGAASSPRPRTSRWRTRTSQLRSVSVNKTGNDGGSQEGAVFTLYEGSDTTGTEIGTCTVDANGDCDDDSFTGLDPGTYTIDETTVPDGYDPDPDLPYTFTLATGDALELTSRTSLGRVRSAS